MNSVVNITFENIREYKRIKGVQENTREKVQENTREKVQENTRESHRKTDSQKVKSKTETAVDPCSKIK